ncbi:MAG: hypothetical protein P8Y37_10840 [Anaerolineales bacterium]
MAKKSDPSKEKFRFTLGSQNNYRLIGLLMGLGVAIALFAALGNLAATIVMGFATATLFLLKSNVKS